MRWNDIGDNGVSSIADGLKHNSTLTKLDIRECGLSVKGIVKYIAIGVRNSYTWFISFLLVIYVQVLFSSVKH